MIVLATTSTVLRVSTSSTANVDTVVDYSDRTSSAVTYGYQTATIAATPGPTTILSAPAASTVRNGKALSIRNRHASTANTIGVEVFDGTNAFQIITVTLSAGDQLMYDEGEGWRTLDSLGRVKLRLDAFVPTAGITLNTVVLSADVINNNGTANTIADVTGLSFAVTLNLRYYFRFIIPYTSAATTTGSRWAINGPATPTELFYRSEYSLTTSSKTFNEGNNAYDLPAASNATSASTATNLAVIEGFIKPSASGTVIARFASEVLSSAITAKAGAVCFWQQV